MNHQSIDGSCLSEKHGAELRLAQILPGEIHTEQFGQIGSWQLREAKQQNWKFKSEVEEILALDKRT
jgi:hypothetical protein